MAALDVPAEVTGPAEDLVAARPGAGSQLFGLAAHGHGMSISDGKSRRKRRDGCLVTHLQGLCVGAASISDCAGGRHGDCRQLVSLGGR
jgi:hypothetical protein